MAIQQYNISNCYFICNLRGYMWFLLSIRNDSNWPGSTSLLPVGCCFSLVSETEGKGLHCLVFGAVLFGFAASNLSKAGNIDTKFLI